MMMMISLSSSPTDVRRIQIDPCESSVTSVSLGTQTEERLYVKHRPLLKNHGIYQLVLFCSETHASILLCTQGAARSIIRLTVKYLCP
jgi:hypothetical protein